MTVRTITGNIHDLQGAIIPNAVITLIPTKFGFGDAASTLILGDEQTFVADAAGDITFDTEEGDYALRFQTKQGLKSVFLRVGSEGPWNLGRLVETLVPVTNQILQDTLAAMDEAKAWATRDEDVEVEPGLYSAYHHAQKAAESEAGAGVSALAASNDADAAASSALAASGSASDAAATLVAFERTYLGAFATNPTVDNEGNPLIVGAKYFNTGDNTEYVYNGTTWEVPFYDSTNVDITGGTANLGGDTSNNPFNVTAYLGSAGAVITKSRRARGTEAAPAALLANDQVWRQYVEAHDGTAFRYMIEQKFDLQGWNGIQPYGRFTIRGEDSAGTNKDMFWVDGDGVGVPTSISVGEKLDDPNILNTLDKSSISGATGFRPLNIIDRNAVAKLSRINSDSGPALELQQWDDTLTTLLSRSFVMAHQNDLTLQNLLAGGAVNFLTASGEKMRVTDTGAVGIGTDNPTYDLHVAGGGQILVEGTTPTYRLNETDQDANHRMLSVGGLLYIQADGVGASNKGKFRVTGNLGEDLIEAQFRTDYFELQQGGVSFLEATPEHVKAPAFIGKYNVKYHGATGNGTTNDSTAVQAALNYAVDNNGPMELPAGKFLLNSAVTKTVASGAARKTGIIGQGQGVSEFIIPSTNTTGGILIDVTGTSDKSDQALFRDFSMETRAVGGVGLRFKQEPGGAQDLNTVICESVRLWTDMTGTKYFATAFEFQGAWRPIVRNCFWAGPVLGYDHTTTDPALGCNRALDITDAYDPIIDTCWFKGAKTGIHSVDLRGGNESETIRITKCVMNQVNRGVLFQRTAREPLLFMDFTHINYKQAGIEVDGAKVGQIVNNSFYNEDTTSEFVGIPTDIRLTNAAYMVVTGNSFQFTGHPNRVGIFVNSDGEAGAGHYNLLSNNMFAEVTLDKAIQIMAGADNNSGSGNVYAGTITTNVANAGAGNTVT